MEHSSAAADAPVIAFISKMVAVPAIAVPVKPGSRPPADPHKEIFLGFGRVFSGVLREGMRLHVLSPLYSSLQPHQHRRVRALFRNERLFFAD
jgi:ribosome assembly protein 1